MDLVDFKKRILDIRAIAPGTKSIIPLIEKLYKDVSFPVEAEVIKIFAVDSIEYDFDENKYGDKDKLEKYFEEKIKPFVLNKIIQYKMNTGDSFYFSEREQEAGVWQIKLLGRKYFVDIEEKMVDEKYLDIEVYLDDWYFD